MPIESGIIKVDITRETKPIGQKGFGTILIVGTGATFTQRINFYTDPDDIAAVVTGGTASMEYIMASTIFSQNPHITTVAIGKKLVDDDTYEDTLAAIKAENADFYGVLLASRVLAEQKEVVQWVQANARVCAIASADVNIPGQPAEVDLTSIARFVKAGSYDRTCVIYHSQAATQAVDAGLLGLILSYDPGSYTGAFKSIAGCTVDKLSETARKNCHAKYASTYQAVAEVPVLLYSYVGTGEFIDIIIFADWLTARIAEANFRLLATTKKMSYNEITSFETATKQVLDRGQKNKGISETEFDKATGLQIGGYMTNFPRSRDIPQNDKALRKLTNAKFKAYLAGAVHSVAIEGTLTL